MSGPDHPPVPSSREVVPRPPVRRAWLAGLGLACLAAGGLVAAWRNRSTDDGSAVAERFYSMTWQDALGRPFDAGALRGRPLIINFWATWCPPCVEEMPELDLLQAELRSSGVTVVGIGIDSETKIRQFAEKTRFTYPLLPAGADGAELARVFGNQSSALPYTVVVSGDGRIRKRILGRFKLEELRQAAQSAAR